MQFRTGPREEEMGAAGMCSRAVLVEQQWDSGEEGESKALFAEASHSWGRLTEQALGGQTNPSVCRG